MCDTMVRKGGSVTPSQTFQKFIVTFGNVMFKVTQDDQFNTKRSEITMTRSTFMYDNIRQASRSIEHLNLIPQFCSLDSKRFIRDRHLIYRCS